MLTFLRRLRQSIAGPGSTKRYLLYAIGEIALVMIGILLALQVSNWNNEIADVRTEKDYLQRLVTELNENIVYYKEVRRRFLVEEERLNRILSLWQGNEAIVPDSTQYMEDFLAPSNIHLWYNEPVTWTQLIQTGDLKVLKNREIVIEIFQYYSQLKKSADNFMLYPFQQVAKARTLWTDAFVDQEPGSYRWALLSNSEVPIQVPSSEVYDFIWENRKVYQKLYTNLSAIYRANYLSMGKIIDNGEELLTKIEGYLEE